MAEAQTTEKVGFGLGYSGGGMGGPTIGTLEHKIQTDMMLSAADRAITLQRFRQEVRSLPSSTPLSSITAGLGGGILGFLVSKYFNLSTVGRAVSTALGFGVGRTTANFYKATGQMMGRGGYQGKARYL